MAWVLRGNIQGPQGPAGPQITVVWNPITLISGYASQNGTPAYAVMPDGSIRLSGGIKKTTPPMVTGTQIATMSSAGLPDRNLEFAVATTDTGGFTTGRLEITPTGVMTIWLSAGQTAVAWIALDGITYPKTTGI